MSSLITRMLGKVKSFKIPRPTLTVSFLGLNKNSKKNADKRKTEKGKSTQIKKLNEILKFFSPANRQSLVKMFDLQKVIVLAKMKLINTLNKLSNVDTFLKTKRGYRVTGQEGYVAIDKLGGDAVKIVDRMEFSYANFSPDVLKGWDKPFGKELRWQNRCRLKT